MKLHTFFIFMNDTDLFSKAVGVIAAMPDVQFNVRSCSIDGIQ
jgi:hypothetical protein